ncbi:MAG: hypothetical protein GYA16_12255 [Spirochaetes bacterium]|nr:hypothetical protein [Spirochaetota bacterium]
MYNIYVSFVVTRKFLFLKTTEFSGAVVSSERMPTSQNDMLGLAAYIAKNIIHLKKNDVLVIINMFSLGLVNTNAKQTHHSRTTKKNNN